MALSFSRKGILAAVCACLLLATHVAAAPISFSARINEELRVADTDVVQHAGKSYVSLNSLVKQLGGGCSVSPERIQVDITAKSAWLRASQTGVNASLGSFSLTNPVVAQGNDALISLEDVGPFFEQAFRMGVRQDVAAQPQPLPPQVMEEEIPELEPVASIAPPAAPETAAGQTPLDTPGQTPPAAPNEAAPALEPLGDPAADAPATPGVSEMSLAQPEEASATPRNIGRAIEVIIIDPGHGGGDKGCESPNGVQESAITMQLAERLRLALEKGSPLRALVTRDKDKGLSRNERVNFANGSRGDLFVSLHVAASFSPSASGATVYRCAPAPDATAADPQSRKLPPAGYDYVPRSLEAATLVGTALSAPVRALPMQVLKEVAMPGLLLEVGYLTNAEDEKNLQAEAWQQQTAETLATVIKQIAGGAVPGVAP